jgi:hypothetical protein
MVAFERPRASRRYHLVMRVQVGPLPSAGVGLWIAYARTVVTRVIVHPEELDGRVRPSTIEAFEGYLDQWDAVAASGPTFLWTIEITPEAVRSLGSAFLEIAEHLAQAATRRGYPIAPPEGDEFYHAMVSAFLDALSQEDGENRALADSLRESWPGLKAE